LNSNTSIACKRHSLCRPEKSRKKDDLGQLPRAFSGGLPSGNSRKCRKECRCPAYPRRLAGDPPSIADPNAVFNQARPELETLDNWREFKWEGDRGPDSWTTRSRGHNKLNETLTVSGTGAERPDPNYDRAGNMTDGPYAITCGTRRTFWAADVECDGYGDNN
jgi:hypothetical protein